MAFQNLLHDVPVRSISGTHELNFEYPVERDLFVSRSPENAAFPPPVISPDEPGSRRLLLGRQFVEDLQLSGIEQIPECLVIAPSDRVSMLACMLRMKSSVPGFNQVERALALQKINNACGGLSGGAASELIALLNVPANPAHLQNYLLLAQSSGTIKNLVASGSVHPNTAFEVFKFEKSSRDELCIFVAGLGLGTRKRNQLLDMIYDICRRDGTNVQACIHDQQVARIMASHQDPPQRAKAVFDHFEKMRCPEMTEYRDRFMRKLQDTGLLRWARVSLPRDFERWEFTLSVRFDSAGGLRDSLRHIQDIVEGEDFEDLMNTRY